MTKESKKKKSKTEKLENIVILRMQLANQLSDIINEYYNQILKERSYGLSTLKPIDIIAVLELLKLKFFCDYTRNNLQEWNKTEDIPILKNKEKR